MKKHMMFLRALVMATLGIASVAQAQSTVDTVMDQGNFFVEGNLGMSFWSPVANYYDDDGEPSVAVRAGYRWRFNDVHSFGGDVGFVYFGGIEDGSPGLNAQLDANALTLGANYKYQLPFWENTFAEARAGLMLLMVDQSYTSTLYSSSSDHSETGMYVGVGAAHWVLPQLAVSVHIDYYQAEISQRIGDDLNMTMVSVGLQYRF